MGVTLTRLVWRKDGGDGVGKDIWGGEGVFSYKFVVRYMLNIALALYADELCLRRILIETE